MNPQDDINLVEGLGPIRDIIAGNHHSLAFGDEGIWVWGKSSSCNLGISTQQQNIDRPIYLEIGAQNGSAGNEHSFIWKQNEVFCWGSNRDFKLGLDEMQDYELTKLDIFSEAVETGMQLCQISCGDSHSLAAFKMEEEEEASYQIFAWGESKNYQLALETEGAVSEPILIDFSQSVSQIYSKSDYNFIITLEGDCYSWGTNLFGRLGFANYVKNQKIPTKIKTLTKIKSISMGKYHCIGINDNGEAFSWGHGMHGQLGLNQIVSEATPTKIEIPQRILQSSCGEYHSVILTQNMELLSCGTNAYNALGHNKVDPKKRCKKFTAIEMGGLKIKKIVSGNRHNLMLTETGFVYSWGCNKCGQLGRGQAQNVAEGIKRDLYKGPQEPINMKKNEIQASKLSLSSSPFLELRYNYSPELKQSKQVETTLNLKDKFSDWKARYQKFKSETELQQKQFMRELDEILKGTK